MTSRIIYAGTHQTAAQFVRGQLAYMREKGFDVTLLTSPGGALRAWRMKTASAWLAGVRVRI